MSHRSSVVAAFILVLSLALAGPALAQDATVGGDEMPGQTAQSSSSQEADDDAGLAKKLTNPVADLVSVPFQFNWAQGVGPDDATRFILNVQPVMPFGISEDWNLITRAIVPIIGMPRLYPGGDPASGVGDVLMSFFLSPKSGPFVWGVGPVLSLPSTGEPTLGTGRWSAGPTVVLLQQSGKLTYGFLANHLWSFGGDQSRADVSQLFVQPFLAYVTKGAVTFSLNSEMAANWKAAEGERWTVPLNFAVSKLASFGPLPASYQIGVGYYLDKPSGGPDWQLRLGMTALLPKKK